MTTMTLRKALGVLAKSSPFSVSTVSKRQNDCFDGLKEKLYVKQQIETDFAQLLCSLKSNEIIFLCGSSGDGKSEILTRYYNEYKDKCSFHMDATHSFAPHQSAIDALDQVFDTNVSSSQPLVVGINIGMLANFAKEGASRHACLREKMDVFLASEERKVDNLYFLDFEKYPKFNFTEDGYASSSFAKELMRNLTRSDSENPFYCLATEDEKRATDQMLLANFKLLALGGVQDVIITYLFKARLIKDQFITTRALLDFLHHLLLGPGYIFDNLFESNGNDLVGRLEDFDPVRIHTQSLDQFVLRYELGLPDEELDVFLLELKEFNISLTRGNESRGAAASLIRLFSLMRNESLGNGYHQKYKGEFDENLLTRYSKVWKLHNDYDGSSESQTALKRFYNNELMTGIQRYANRRAPELRMAKDEIFLGAFGSVKLSASIKVKVDFESIDKSIKEKNTYFNARLKISNQILPPIQINLNFYELICKLNSGYRPNKYDKSAVVFLDEVVGHITTIAKSTSVLKFYEGNKTYFASHEDGRFEIRGEL
ncbi:DNA phosphorothioation-dependent restriction protein DptF [Pseudomonas sp. C6002]|uniref:DNA phosphorothioation-dependent restriction protein DptF n=1 Tax=Pseudomonas sp. C6002 TaxID=2738814 RepID=UPI0015A26944|nr:DNA phosphorothioation-dependent restriction protein DptF [Pseudomonas sp. C6002]NWA32031.1 DNA phosphorothioation-dependent restriction protein DptF [Pseudomonas sp. C6002]